MAQHIRHTQCDGPRRHRGAEGERRVHIRARHALAQAMCPIALRVGDYETVESSIQLLEELTGRYALGPWAILSECWKAAVAIAQGDCDLGTRMLAVNLERVHDARFCFYRTQFMSTLAAAIAQRGDVAQGLAMMDAALARCQLKEEIWCLPELLRLKGSILLLAHSGNDSQVEVLYGESLLQARRQQAFSWELRAALSLAQLKRLAGSIDEARNTVAGVYQRFTEGFASVDVKSAREFIESTS